METQIPSLSVVFNEGILITNVAGFGSIFSHWHRSASGGATALKSEVEI